MMPLWKFPRSSRSFGACAFSSGRPTPKSTLGSPSSSWNVETTGIDPPSRLKTGACAEALLDRAAGGAHVFVVELGHPRLAAVHARDLQLDGLRADLLQVGLEEIADLLRILIGHEAHADLGHRRRRQHGLRAFTGES